MANVTLRNVGKTYGEAPVLAGVNLCIEDGEFAVFVGPSGCGKSTLLRMIAGLEDITSGDLLIGDTRVNDVPAAQRGIAMVFQSYALYPHMNLFENMAFSLRLAKQPQDKITAAVHRAADILHIRHLLDRKPKSLSGGQRQRVAIGRAIVRQPKVFLFDEPLSNLDAALRIKMRYEFTRLHQELKTTMIYVTHDQVEAMTLADKIVVLSAGKIEQVGRPLDLYHYPANLFVAGFIGSPRMNFLDATLVDSGADHATVSLADGRVWELDVDARSARPGDRAIVGVRPEHIQLHGTGNALSAEVNFVECLGDATYLYASAAGAQEGVTAKVRADMTARAGDVVTLAVPRESCHLFDTQGKAFTRRYRFEQKLAA
ncbi:MAG: sn-glycerol-3-phosphate ABC transporter ATP-binding protein UgpC [Alcaligenaceae bacterium]|nr:MAG: sn-glycerol-3-phosphate ABC transporter ATP-binding protein UgpC [Alcaligenaceae bacterium]